MENSTSQYLSVNCAVCNSNVTHLTDGKSAKVPDVTIYVSICRNCGFVTQNPRPNSKFYKEINAKWFGGKYSNTPTVINNLNRWELMWRRISRFFDCPPKTVLDIGSQYGNALSFLKKINPKLEAWAMEPVSDYHEYLRKNINAEVVNCPFDEEWPEILHNKFDLIILRHTLEHLENPVKTLGNISKCLKKDGGKLYLVVPNLMKVKPQKRIRTDFFRIVHLHYFNITTLERISSRAGLSPITLSDDNELWGLFEYSPQKASIKVFENTFERQYTFIKSRLKEAWVMDTFFALKLAIKKFIPIER